MNALCSCYVYDVSIRDCVWWFSCLKPFTKAKEDEDWEELHTIEKNRWSRKQNMDLLKTDAGIFALAWLVSFYWFGLFCFGFWFSYVLCIVQLITLGPWYFFNQAKKITKRVHAIFMRIDWTMNIEIVLVGIEYAAGKICI